MLAWVFVLSSSMILPDASAAGTHALSAPRSWSDPILLCLYAALIGAFLVIGILLSRLAVERARSEERDRSHRALLSQSGTGGATGEALTLAMQQFVALADDSLKTRLDPVGETFARFHAKVESFEKADVEARATVAEQLRQVQMSVSATRDVTGKLVNALRASPKTRGNWGEQTLRNVLELAGLVRGTDFDEQSHTQTETGALRPDVTIRLAGGGVLVVDAKVALDAWLAALEADDDTGRAAHMARHASQMRTHMKGLASKEYWKALPDTPDFVAMFVPGDAFLSAALEQDPALFDDAIRQKVLICTPVTLIALAKSVAWGWRQDHVQKTAQEIADLGRELHDRLANMGEKIGKLGRSIGSAVEDYNTMVGGLEGRVMVSARRLRELDPGIDTDLGVLHPVEKAPRQISGGG
jgi:DNA recombination protein RmuC